MTPDHPSPPPPSHRWGWASLLTTEPWPASCKDEATQHAPPAPATRAKGHTNPVPDIYVSKPPQGRESLDGISALRHGLQGGQAPCQDQPLPSTLREVSTKPRAWGHREGHLAAPVGWEGSLPWVSDGGGPSFPVPITTSAGTAAQCPARGCTLHPAHRPPAASRVPHWPSTEGAREPAPLDASTGTTAAAPGLLEQPFFFEGLEISYVTKKLLRMFQFS